MSPTAISAAGKATGEPGRVVYLKAFRATDLVGIAHIARRPGPVLDVSVH